MNATALRLVTPADADWITERHAALYAQDEGFDQSFGPLVAGILASFFHSHDPARERGWVAVSGAGEHAGQADVRLGSIFCVAGPDGTAKLRLFFVEPAARGTGLAQTMLAQCLHFARDAGYPRIRLWTHESHRAAGRLYARNGFLLTDSIAAFSFGQDVIEQTWERAL